MPRQRHGLLGQCAVLRGVGFGQLQVGQHAQGVALMRGIAQGFEPLCGVGSAARGQCGVDTQRCRGPAQQGQRHQRRALGCGCQLGGLQGALSRLQGLRVVLLTRLHQRQIAKGARARGLRPRTRMRLLSQRQLCLCIGQRTRQFAQRHQALDALVQQGVPFGRRQAGRGQRGGGGLHGVGMAAGTGQVSHALRRGFGHVGCSTQGSLLHRTHRFSATPLDAAISASTSASTRMGLVT